MVALLEPRVARGVDPAALSDPALADELIRRRAEIDRLEAEFAHLAWAGHQRGIGAVDGSPSTAAWLRRHTGMRDGDARGGTLAWFVSHVRAKLQHDGGPHSGHSGGEECCLRLPDGARHLQ